MIKTGIVIRCMNRKVGIMTENGEFLYIKINKVLPNVGEVYTGELSKKNLSFYKYAITAASLMFIIVSSTFANAYYTPVTTIVLTINPSVSLEANRWNKIISSKALNSDGDLLLKDIKLSNKSIDIGLELLVKQAKTEHFINEDYVTAKKSITVDIKSKTDHSIDISNLKSIIDSNNLNITINTFSKDNKNIDITVKNEKINTSNVAPKGKEKEAIEKNSNIKINPPKNPSVNISPKTKESNSSKVKKNAKNPSNTKITDDLSSKKDDAFEKEKPKDTNNTPSSPIKESELIKKTVPSSKVKK